MSGGLCAKGSSLWFPFCEKASKKIGCSLPWSARTVEYTFRVFADYLMSRALFAPTKEEMKNDFEQVVKIDHWRLALAAGGFAIHTFVSTIGDPKDSRQLVRDVFPKSIRDVSGINPLFCFAAYQLPSGVIAFNHMKSAGYLLKNLDAVYELMQNPKQSLGIENFDRNTYIKHCSHRMLSSVAVDAVFWLLVMSTAKAFDYIKDTQRSFNVVRVTYLPIVREIVCKIARTVLVDWSFHREIPSLVAKLRKKIAEQSVQASEPDANLD